MSSPIRIRLLGSWWDAPEGDFPIRALAARIRELRDSEIVKLDDGAIVAVRLYEDSISYGLGVFVVTKQKAFLVMLRDAEDCEALKEYLREKYGEITSSKLVEVLSDIARRESGIVELS
ncbi:MAG TPA: hypothetical protein ENF93_01140 [Ignisphaera sp.]|nr:hypothetical protein [Ignisphaera sp.]